MFEGTVGLIGLGLLGKALAQRLIAAEYTVLGYDVDEEARNEAAALGVAVAADARAVSRGCKRILLSLPNSDIRHDLLFGEDALAESFAKGSLVLDTTTGRAEDLEGDALRLAVLEVDLIDVCVLASSVQTASGEAVLLVGDREDHASCYRDLLDCISRRVFFLGAPGMGCRMKLVANQAIGLHRLVLAETLGLAEKAGLDLGTTLEVLQAGPAASAVMETKGQKMLVGDFTPQARLAQHAKDVGLILEMALAVGATVPLSTLHRDVLAGLLRDGYGAEDNAAVVRAFRSALP